MVSPFGYNHISIKYLLDSDSASTLIAQGTQISRAASTVDTVYEGIVDLRTRLTKANTPSKDNRRYLLVTPDFYALLLKEDHFVGSSDLGNEVKHSGTSRKQQNPRPATETA